MSRILIFSTDNIRSGTGNLLGPAIRYLELGRALVRKGHDVYLCDPGTKEKADDNGIHFIPRRRSEISTLRERIDVVLFNPYVIPSPAASPPLIQTLCKNIPAVVDLYDPAIVEEVTVWRLNGWSNVQAGIYSQQLSSLLWSLQAGDYFLCASESQKLYYMGLLTAAGRYTPAFDIEERIGIVPIGIPSEPPSKNTGVFQKVGIKTDDLVFLWPGGLFDWYDGVSAVNGFAMVARDNLNIHLVFVGAFSPNWVHPSPEYERTMGAARASGLLGRQIHFLDWVPYSSRESLYLESDCVILTYRGGLENSLSYRSRILDAIWGGLPMILSAGNELSELVSSKGAGLTVQNCDHHDIAEKMRNVLADQTMRRRMSANMPGLASRFQWDTTVMPLHEFCDSPSIAQDKRNRKVRNLMSRDFKARNRRILLRVLSERTLEILSEESVLDLARRARVYLRGMY